MSTIRFKFDDLCAFFTSRAPHVMVGLIDTSDAPPQDIHYPHIIIEEEGGAIVGEYHGFTQQGFNYHGFGQIYGDIFLDIHPQPEPLRFYAPSAAPGTKDERQPFQTLVDIEQTLYPQQPLPVRPDRCRARLHFRNGELYACGPLHEVKFADLATRTVSEYHSPRQTASRAGLDVFVPDHGYAVLHFQGGAPDFVFKGGKNYQVQITNQAKSFTSEHFQYFYKILEQQPATRLIPVSANTGAAANLLVGGDTFCIPGWFSQVIYRLLTGHLDW